MCVNQGLSERESLHRGGPFGEAVRGADLIENLWDQRKRMTVLFRNELEATAFHDQTEWASFMSPILHDYQHWAHNLLINV